ncbi:FHA domain-containing protein PS1-like [Nicotiana tabacum]|uniref:FHA domain-containing protein PS1-like n=1 Tax=Nicotiana tabacum TaxID=4097 RepID=A0A1S4ANU2_TOBAC|nr:PREDICTED: FHA domain-containing protein PS1-like [Nicotiana tabacum]
MAENQESLENPNLQTELEKKIPLFTVLKHGAILKNIFLLDNPPPITTASIEETKPDFEEILLVVGRHPDCNIVLEHPSISRFHLRVHSNPSTHSLSVIDLSSVHGTWISGNKIEPEVRVDLKEGDKMQLGGSSREYRLHWIPFSRAYDLGNPFAAPLGEAESMEETDQKEHQDESDFALQNEDDDSVQGLDSSFSDMSLLPCVKSLTPSAPPMPEEMKFLFPVGDKAVIVIPPEKIHGESEISLLQPAYEPDKENSTPLAFLVSGGSQTENADSTLVRSHQRYLSIWSRRGKCSSVQIQTGRDRAIIEKVDIDTEVHSLNHDKFGMESVSNDPFSSENKDDEDIFTPDKENHTPSSLFLDSKIKSSLADGQASKPVLSCCMDENAEESFTLDKVDLSPNTDLLRSKKKMSSLKHIKHPKPCRSSPMKEIFDPILHQAKGLEYYKKENIGSSIMLPSMSNNSEEIFTPDKENMKPDSCSMRSKRKGKMVEVKHIKPFEKENLIGKVLEEQKSASVASRNMDSSEVTILKNRTDRPPFRSLLVNSPSNTNSESPEEVKLNANPIKCQQIMEAGPFSDNNAREEKRRWNMVVDTTSLLNKESRKALQLLQGLKGTYLIIPRIVLRELDCMKRRAGFFRRETEVSAALEWIEDCKVNAESWVHVQSCVEEARPMAPTPPATAPPSLFSKENSIFAVGSVLSSPHCGLAEIVSPTAEDHILECALLFKRTNRDGQVVLLSNDLTMKIKAMAEGLNCETAEDFRESLVNPFSERFLWKDSSPRGSTWSCVDDFVLGEPYYPGALKQSSKSGQAAKGLKLILLHNSHYRQICSGSGS